MTFHTLTRENAIAYLQSFHNGTAHIIDVREYLDDATPCIQIDFQQRLESDLTASKNRDGFACTHSLPLTIECWMQRMREDGEPELYGEW